MRPGYATKDETDHCLVDAKLIGNRLLRPAFSAKGANLRDIRFLKLSTASISFATRLGRATYPFSFQAGILHVLSICAKPQVIGINTWRIVASMANLFACWNGAIGKFPRDTMSATVAPVDPEHSIAFAVYGCRPKPAISALINLRPEPLFHCTIHDYSLHRMGY